MQFYDVIVIGLGAMGSAALRDLARRGVRAVGLERFDIPHDRGSYHGLTRIIRMAYHEHPSYVELLRRAYPLWRELEAETGERLLHVTGSLDGGAREGPFVAGSLASCREHGLAHELLDAREIERRFPAFRLPDEFAGVLQPDGGYVLAERSVVTFVDGARRRGAVIRTGEIVSGWRRDLPRCRVDRHRRSLDREASPRARAARAPRASGGRLVSPAAARALRRRAPTLSVISTSASSWVASRSPPSGATSATSAESWRTSPARRSRRGESDRDLEQVYRNLPETIGLMIRING